jgi:hypothetical protein
MFKRSCVIVAATLLALVSPTLIFADSDYKKEYKMSVVVGPKLP